MGLTRHQNRSDAKEDLHCFSADHLLLQLPGQRVHTYTPPPAMEDRRLSSTEQFCAPFFIPRPLAVLIINV